MRIQQRQMQLCQRGFSLIELLVVVAIIGIIAAIAVPNLIQSRRAANESAAVTNLRTITAAQATYRSTFGRLTEEYGSLATLHSSGSLIDSALATADVTPKSGYTFKVTPLPATASDSPGYIAGARPVNNSGRRRFITDDFGVIYFDTNIAAALPIAGRASGTPIGK